MSEYGLKEYKALLEKALLAYDNPMECPCDLDPFKEGILYRNAKREALTYALEMLPEIPND